MADLSDMTLRAMGNAQKRLAQMGEMSKLPVEMRTVVMIFSGQGIINNGGLQFFFEIDFPSCPSYSLFVDAYRAIGTDDAALALEKAVKLFPFSDPHLKIKERNAFMDSCNDEDGEPVNNPFEAFTRVLCGHKGVWQALNSYVQRHADVLGV